MNILNAGASLNSTSMLPAVLAFLQLQANNASIKADHQTLHFHFHFHLGLAIQEGSKNPL
jgi:hypothetical protein